MRHETLLFDEEEIEHLIAVLSTFDIITVVCSEYLTKSLGRQRTENHCGVPPTSPSSILSRAPLRTDSFSFDSFHLFGASTYPKAASLLLDSIRVYKLLGNDPRGPITSSHIGLLVAREWLV